MAKDRQKPGLESVIGRLDRRVARLERHLSQVIDSRRLPGLFSFSGSLEEDVESPPWRPSYPVSVDLIVPQVLVAPTGGSLVIDLTLYGPTTGVVRTLTVPSGDFYVEDAVPFIIPMGGSLTAKVTTASGAEDLAIALTPRLL